MGVATSTVQLRTQHIPELLEVAFDTSGELQAWLATLARAFSRIAGDTETAAGVSRYDDDRNVMMFWPQVVGGDRLERMAAALTPPGEKPRPLSFPTGQFVRYFFPPYVATTQSEIERVVPPAPMVSTVRAAAGIEDMLGLLLHPAPGLVTTVSCVMERKGRLTRTQRILLTRVGLHLETAFRLRLRPEMLRGVLTPKGKLVHSEGGVLNTTLVQEIEKRRSNAEERLAVWTALVDGQCSLVERDALRGVPRHYLLLDNPPLTRERRRLTAIEGTVVHHAARGMPGKTIAYSLGISPPAVSMALNSASWKLGFRSPLVMLQAVKVLVTDPSVVDTDRLTSAERNVLELLLAGGTNLEIAQQRGTSQRTVANQVAAILKKTGADSRRSLRLHLQS